MALVNLGWIFFRAGSLAQAGQMFTALLSPAGYTQHLLHNSLYLLVAVGGVGYGITLIVLDLLDSYAERLQQLPSPGVAAIALRDRWVWIAPIWAVACVLVLTLVPHQSRAANVFLYRFF